MDFSGMERDPRLWPYQQVARAIRKAIASGELAPGERLPAQARIAQMAGVSKTAVQNALAALRDEGLVYGIPRLGTFVSAPPPPGPRPGVIPQPEDQPDP